MSRKINEEAGLYAILGGVLMLIAGTTAASTWAEIGDIVIDITEMQFLWIVFRVLVIIGSFGGLVVILGGLMIHGKMMDSVLGGKILITIGAGFSLISLIILIAVTLMGDEIISTFIAVLGVGFIGLILSIVGRQKAVS